MSVILGNVYNYIINNKVIKNNFQLEMIYLKNVLK